MWQGQRCRRCGGGGGWGEEKCYYTVMEEDNNQYEVVLAAGLCSIFFPGVTSWSCHSCDMKVTRHWEKLFLKQWFTNCYCIIEPLEPSDWSHLKCVHIGITGVSVKIYILNKFQLWKGGGLCWVPSPSWGSLTLPCLSSGTSRLISAPFIQDSPSCSQCHQNFL